MSEKQTSDEQPGAPAPSRPPLPTVPSGGGGIKADSFRGIEYTPPAEVTEEVVQPATKTDDNFLQAVWRRISGRQLNVPEPAETAEVVEELGKQNAPAKAPVTSDEVVEELTKRNSFARRDSQELPPLPPSSPRPMMKTGSGKVGLQSVKLVPLEVPTSGEQTSETAKTTEAMQKTESMETEEGTTKVVGVAAPSGETEAVIGGKKKETEGLVSFPVVPRLSTDDPEHETEVHVPSADAAKTTAVSTQVVKTTTTTGVTTEEPFAELLKKKEATEETAVAVVKEGVAKEGTTTDAASLLEETTETKEIVPPALGTTVQGVGGSMKETKKQSPVKPLKTTQSLATSTPSGRKLFRRLFSLGGSPDAQKAKEKTVKEEEVIAEKEQHETIRTEEAPKEAESTTSVVVPSGSQSPAVAKEAPVETTATIEEETFVAKEKPKHERVASDLTPTELDSLKDRLMLAMIEKGIDVEGKYTKSRADFDSPLLYLLDLHFFSETQHSTIKMEQLLSQTYGRGTSIVSEFSEAAARESMSPKTAEALVVQEEVRTETKEANLLIYETGLDTAKEGSGEGTNVMPTASTSFELWNRVEQETTTAAEKAVNQSSEAVEEIKESTVTAESDVKQATAAADVESSQVVATETQSPPTIPYRNEADQGAKEPGRCFFCACLAPKAS